MTAVDSGTLPPPVAARCAWAGDDPLYRHYHDEEWGVPVWDERRLFEFLILEGAQAGLSWITILKKRDAYRRAFDGFDPHAMATYDARKVEALLGDPGIVRNRAKIAAAIDNARAWLEVERRGDRPARLLWSFTGGRTVQNRWRRMEDVPARSPASEAMSTELRRRGFRFVGPTICYAFMQAVGMVNDHTVDCFRHRELGGD
jgi:DNA-3-methyladenine glycosylase I